MLLGLAVDSMSDGITSTAPLYHYTSADGLLGILRSEALYASNYAFMNDSAEMTYGASLARPIINARFTQVQGVAGAILQRTLAIIRAARVDTFIFSFCEKPDVLSQWRGYGTNASRYAIGFDRQRLLGMSQAAVVPLRVIYDAAAQQKKVAQFCDSVLDILAEQQLPDDRETAEDLAIAIAVRFFNLLPLLKHGGFSEECEWRLVATSFDDPEAMDFVVRAGMLRPYLPIRPSAASRLPITEVLVGYSPHPERAVRSVAMLLKHFGYDTPVRVTDLPFIE
jgi:Protein of unknown function (DUF2971).